MNPPNGGLKLAPRAPFQRVKGYFLREVKERLSVAILGAAGACFGESEVNTELGGLLLADADEVTRELVDLVWGAAKIGLVHHGDSDGVVDGIGGKSLEDPSDVEVTAHVFELGAQRINLVELVFGEGFFSSSPLPSSAWQMLPAAR